MDNIHCSLCGGLLKSIEFDLKRTNSEHSHTPLISLVEKVVGTLFLYTYFSICEQCYSLINELDAIELRQIEIHKQLKKYIEMSKSQVDLIEVNPLEKIIINEVKCEVGTVELLDCNENDKLVKRESDLKFDTDISNSNLFENKVELIINLKSISGPTMKKKGKKKKFPDTAKPHKCHCLKEFRTLSELKNHMNSHSNYRPFICDICGQSYKHKAAFNIHMNMHNGITPFTCLYCNKSFTQKGALVRHVPIHTGEMPYQCDECGKRFVHHTSFNIHRLSHTGQKSYKCNLCGLALMSGSHLKRHMRIHTGEKKFACDICGKRFAERYNLAVHEKLHYNPDSILSQKTNCSSQTNNVPLEKKIKTLDEHQSDLPFDEN